MKKISFFQFTFLCSMLLISTSMLAMEPAGVQSTTLTPGDSGNGLAVMPSTTPATIPAEVRPSDTESDDLWSHITHVSGEALESCKQRGKRSFGNFFDGCKQLYYGVADYFGYEISSDSVPFTSTLPESPVTPATPASDGSTSGAKEGLWEHTARVSDDALERCKENGLNSLKSFPEGLNQFDDGINEYLHRGKYKDEPIEEPIKVSTKHRSMLTRFLNAIHNWSRSYVPYDADSCDAVYAVQDEIERSHQLTEIDQAKVDAYLAALNSGAPAADILRLGNEKIFREWDVKHWHEFVDSGPQQPTDGDWVIAAAKETFELFKLPSGTGKYHQFAQCLRLLSGDIAGFIGNFSILDSVNLDPKISAPVNLYKAYHDGSLINAYFANSGVGKLLQSSGARQWLLDHNVPKWVVDDSILNVFSLFRILKYGSFTDWVKNGTALSVKLGTKFLPESVKKSAYQLTTKGIAYVTLPALEYMGCLTNAQVCFLLNDPDIQNLFTAYPELMEIPELIFERVVFGAKDGASTSSSPSTSTAPAQGAAVDTVKFSEIIGVLKKMAPYCKEEGVPTDGAPANEEPTFGPLTKAQAESEKNRKDFFDGVKRLNEMLGITLRISDLKSTMITNASQAASAAKNTVSNVSESISDGVDKLVDLGLNGIAVAGKTVDYLEKRKVLQHFWDAITFQEPELLAGEFFEQFEDHPAAAPVVVPAAPAVNAYNPGLKMKALTTFCKIAARNKPLLGPLLDGVISKIVGSKSTEAASTNSTTPTTQTQSTHDAFGNLASLGWEGAKQALWDGGYRVIKETIDKAIEERGFPANSEVYYEGLLKEFENAIFGITLDKLETVPGSVCAVYTPGSSSADASTSSSPAPDNSPSRWSKLKTAFERSRQFLESLDILPEEASELGRYLRQKLIENGLPGEVVNQLLINTVGSKAEFCREVAQVLDAPKTPEELETEAAVKQVKDELKAQSIAGEKEKKALASVLNKPIFEIPVWNNHLSLALYKKDILKFIIRLLDYEIDKMLFNQMNKHYLSKVTSRLQEKKDKLVGVLDKYSSNGELGLTDTGDIFMADDSNYQERLISSWFIDESVEAVNVGRTSLNLKWLFVLLSHAILKHLLYKLEEAASEDYMFWNAFESHFNLSIKAPSFPERLKQMNLTELFNFSCDYLGSPAREQDQKFEELKTGAATMTKDYFVNWAKNTKFILSVYPLIDLLCFGHVPVNFRIESVYKNIVYSMRFISQFLLLKVLDKGSAMPITSGLCGSDNFLNFVMTTNNKFFDVIESEAACFLMRVAGLALFLRNMNNIYQAELKNYIKNNIHLFIKIVSDIKHASEMGPNEIGYQDIALKEFLKEAHKTSFEAWRSSKGFSANKFFAAGSALSIVGGGLGLVTLGIN